MWPWYQMRTAPRAARWPSISMKTACIGYLPTATPRLAKSFSAPLALRPSAARWWRSAPSAAATGPPEVIAAWYARESASGPLSARRSRLSLTATTEPRTRLTAPKEHHHPTRRASRSPALLEARVEVPALALAAAGFAGARAETSIAGRPAAA